MSGKPLALDSRETPSALCLSRQNLPTLRRDVTENLCAKGAYVLVDPGAKRDVTILATGSEVATAVDAAQMLSAEGKKVAVVSMPSWELFAAQPEAWRKAVLGTAPRIGVEAGARLGWDRWLGETGVFIGMNGFGASAPASDLYAHFGITAEAIVQAAKKLTA